MCSSLNQERVVVNGSYCSSDISARATLNVVNQHLVCALCSGYLVDATAVIECLHTFCRSCILRYLESSQTCPVCDVPLHENSPLLGIRPDTTLQRLVYKMVPGVYKEEIKRRFAFFSGLSTGVKNVSRDQLLKDVDEYNLGQKMYSGEETFSVCLRYRSSCAAPGDVNTILRSGEQNQIETRYVLCPALLTVAHLKKLIANKLDLSVRLTEEYQLDLFYVDEMLKDEYTLMDIAYITEWSGTAPLQFDYTLSRPLGRHLAFHSEHATTSRHPVSPLCMGADSNGSKSPAKRSKLGSVFNKLTKTSKRKRKHPSAIRRKTSAATGGKPSPVRHQQQQPPTKSAVSSRHQTLVPAASTTTVDAKRDGADAASTAETKETLTSPPTNSKDCAATASKVLTAVQKVLLSCGGSSFSKTKTPTSPFDGAKFIPTAGGACIERISGLNHKESSSLTSCRKSNQSKGCSVKPGADVRKSIISKFKVAKYGRPGRVYISNVNVSKVNAAKYLVFPKVGLWKERSSSSFNDGFVRKQCINKMNDAAKQTSFPAKKSSAFIFNDLAMEKPAANTVVDDKDTVPDTLNAVSGAVACCPPTGTAKELAVTSSSNYCDSSNNDNVVSSSTSPQQTTDYDNDDVVTSADTQTLDEISSMSSPPPSFATALRLIDSNDVRTAAISGEANTLRVPLRVGDRGERAELLVRLPQNVSVECSIRPVSSAVNEPTSGCDDDDQSATSESSFRPVSSTVDLPSPAVGDRQSPVDNPDPSVSLCPQDQLQHSDVELSMVEMTASGDDAVAPTFAASADSLALPPFTTKQTCSGSSCSVSSPNDNKTDDDPLTPTNEQPEISLFPFVTVSRPRVQKPPTSSSSPAPCGVGDRHQSSAAAAANASVSATAVRSRQSSSPVHASVSQPLLVPSSSSSETSAPSVDTVSGAQLPTATPGLHREIIKVPIYTALPRADSKADRRQSTAARSAASCSSSRADAIALPAKGQKSSDLDRSSSSSSSTAVHVNSKKTVDETVPSVTCHPERLRPSPYVSVVNCSRLLDTVSGNRSQTNDLNTKRDVRTVNTGRPHKSTVDRKTAAKEDTVSPQRCEKEDVVLRKDKQPIASTSKKTTPASVGLERCNSLDDLTAVAPSVAAAAPATTKRLKLMCNGITIYRTIDDDVGCSYDSKACTSGKKRRRQPAAQLSKSFELVTKKPRTVKRRHRSTPAGTELVLLQHQNQQLQQQPAAMDDVKNATTTDAVAVQSEVLDMSVTTNAAAAVGVTTDSSANAIGACCSAGGAVVYTAACLLPVCMDSTAAVADDCNEPLELTTPQVRERYQRDNSLNYAVVPTTDDDTDVVLNLSCSATSTATAAATVQFTR